MKRFVLIITIAIVTAAAARAQTIEDTVPRQRTIPLREELRRQVEESRFRFGAIRVLPLFAVSNAGYVDNVFGSDEEDEKVSDYTATITAGSRFVLPAGRKVFLRATALPEYTYYHELEQNRSLGGFYGGEFLALFNRVSLQAEASASERVTLLGNEVETPIEATNRMGSLRAEVDILPRVALFGRVSRRDFAYEPMRETPEDDESRHVLELSRVDETIRGGVRYRVREFFDVSAAMEQTSSAFDVPAAEELRGNETEAVLVGLFYDRPRLFVNLNGGRRTGEATRPAGDFPRYSEAIGSYFTTFRLNRAVELESSGRRGAVYSLFTANPYFLETRYGGGVRIYAGHRVIFRLFADAGRNEYPREVLLGDTTRLKRVDDVKAAGAEVTVRVYRNLAWVVGATKSDYDSNLPGYDRSILRVTSSLLVRGDLFR